MMGRDDDENGSDDAIDYRRYFHIYRKRSPSECDVSCPNVRDIHPGWSGTIHLGQATMGIGRGWGLVPKDGGSPSQIETHGDFL